jgi:hypothetical protein
MLQRGDWLLCIVICPISVLAVFFRRYYYSIKNLSDSQKNVGRMSTFFVANIHKQKFLNESKIAHNRDFDFIETSFRKTNQGTILQ